MHALIFWFSVGLLTPFILLVGLFLAITAVGLLAIRTTTHGTAYVGAAGQMRMLSQRLATEAQQGLQGTAEAFTRLKRSRDEFADLVQALGSGGMVGGAEVPTSADSVRPALDKVAQLWQKTDKNIALDRWVSERVARKGVRYYAESTVLYDE